MPNLKVRLPASGSAIAILLIAMATLFEQPRARAVEPVVPGEWPPIKLGVWNIETTRVLPNGRTKHDGGSGPICSDSSYFFIGYWGGGKVEREGCRYIATKVTDDRFKIATECFVHGLAAPSHGDVEVTMHGPESFEMKGTTKEGKKTYRVTQVGRRLSDCPPAPSESRHR